MTLTLTRTRGELAAALKPARVGDGRIVLVPTMGALHDGHIDLIRQAREHGSLVVVSIFVNPSQFGPGEDFERYPRTLDSDLALCESAGADVVFAPAVNDVYAGGDWQVSVDPGDLGNQLEGEVRPGHFRGVLLIVAKLLNLVRPDAAVFGEKDYQQLVLIRRMVIDLCMGVEVHAGRTVREDDGLALSSRNAYLSAEDRPSARALSQALRAGVEAADRGASAVLAAAHARLDTTPGLDLDYLDLRDPDLGPAPAQGPARLLVAARVGSTRLIDNSSLELGPDTGLDGPED